MSVVYIIIGVILSWVLTLEAYLLGQLSGLFDFLMLSVNKNVAAFDAVQYGWVTVRDVFNMFFIFFLLIIAFATVLRVENWQYKQLLPKLIIAILLVNFSRTICGVFIELSNVLMRTFTLGVGKTSLASVLMTNLKLHNLQSIGSKITATQISDGPMAAGMFILAAYVGVFILALLAICALLVTRIVALMFLTVLSPAAFVMNILPNTQQYAQKWWEEFLKYIIYGPAASFLLYLSIRTSATLAQKGAFTNFSSDQIKAQMTNSSVAGFYNPFAGTFDLDSFFAFALVMAFLFGTVLLVRGLGSFGAAALLGAGTALLGKGLKFGTLAPMALMSHQLQSGKKGLLGKTLGVGAGLLAGTGTWATGKGFGKGWQGGREVAGKVADNTLPFMSPTLLYRAGAAVFGGVASRQKLGAQGRVENLFGKLVGATSDSEAQEIGLAIQEEGKNMDLRTGGSAKAEVQEFSNASKGPFGKNEVAQQAAYLKLGRKNLLGMLFKDAEKDEDVRAGLFGADYESTDHFKRNGYVNNNANRMYTADRVFNGKGKQALDGIASTMMSQGDYSQLGGVDFSKGERIWVGDDKGWDKNENMTAEDIENAREREIAMLGSKLIQNLSAIERGRVALTTVLVDGAETPTLGRNELERAIQGNQNAQENERQYFQMNGRIKNETSGPEIIEQRMNNAAASMILNSVFSGRTKQRKNNVGNNDYDKEKGINGASWDLTCIAGAKRIKDTDTKGMVDLKNEFNKRIDEFVNGGKKDEFKALLRKIDPEYFSNRNNLNAAMAEITSQFSSSDIDANLDEMFKYVRTGNK